MLIQLGKTPQLPASVLRGTSIIRKGPQIDPFRSYLSVLHIHPIRTTYARRAEGYGNLTTRVQNFKYSGAHIYSNRIQLHTTAGQNKQMGIHDDVHKCRYNNSYGYFYLQPYLFRGSGRSFSTIEGNRQAQKGVAEQGEPHTGSISEAYLQSVESAQVQSPPHSSTGTDTYETSHITLNIDKEKDADRVKPVPNSDTEPGGGRNNKTNSEDGTNTDTHGVNDTNIDTATSQQHTPIYSDAGDDPDSFEPMPRDKANYELDRIAKVGGVVNVCLMLIKGGAGVVVGSAGLLASAADSCSDLVGDAVLLWALEAAKKPPSIEHPWGHGRLETVASLGTGTLMLGAGLSVGWHSGIGLYDNFMASYGETISEHSHMLNSDWLPLGIGVALVSILSKEWLYRTTLKTAHSVGGSRVLEAHAHHHRSDALSAVAALFGLVGGMYGMGWADGVAGLLVSWLIAKQGGKICYESLSELADAGLDEGELKEMLVSARSIQGVEDIIHERARRLGPFVEFHATILVDPWQSISGARDLAEECRRIVMRQNTRVKFCLITTRPKRFAFEPCKHTGEGTRELKDMGMDEGIEPGMQDLGLWGDDHNHCMDEGQSHFSRRVMTEKLLRKTASSFPGITSVNRITLHRLHEDYKHIMTGYVVNITIDLADSDLMRCRQIALKLQKQLEKIELPDGSRPVKECDVHMDLTNIPSESL
ncbi:hypothetical protein SARC_13095 [Sphaeroforma arctica JP610]|uniref:Cation efflux protein transmembrane domain-containing protein n=1 Tax=Sphaeroforma arctica JP610 TaxID=667725 RepID=A0A0L0FC93_9EUKA|nr:hypothetical protein SARC_13095 [Sphaeroforma arctica JP610]KNC74354.1 hypothetical protein SARC_13095 [Sphaeroforma arctica JP610]|eukprot:XP_014148256.1 hypothetical protein SARC_13095 [Sphaeroforma arctica JP610]